MSEQKQCQQCKCPVSGKEHHCPNAQQYPKIRDLKCNCCGDCIKKCEAEL